MWTIQHTVRLQCDEAPGEVVDITVTEYMDEWPGLDAWEQKVRDLGFQAMRKMLAGGFLLREHALLRTWTHLGRLPADTAWADAGHADQHGWKGPYPPSAAVLQAMQGVGHPTE